MVLGSDIDMGVQPGVMMQMGADLRRNVLRPQPQACAMIPSGEDDVNETAAFIDVMNVDECSP